MPSFLASLIPGSLPGRIALGVAGGLLGILALIGAVLALVGAVRSWTTEIYNDGFRAGSEQVRAQWNAANTTAVTAQRDQLARDAIQSNQSVKTYLDQIMARKPEVIRVAERTTVYAQSPAGAAQCLDADGVQLIRANRTANGYPASAASGTPGAVPGTLPVAGGTGNQR